MKLLAISNLYPSPVEPNRATFNKQQFSGLAEHLDLDVAVPVAWTSYLKNRSTYQNATSETLQYFPYFYTPKFFRNQYGKFMAYSLLRGVSGWINERGYDAILGTWAYPDGFAASQLADKLGIPFYLKVHGSDINVLAHMPHLQRAVIDVCRSAKGVITVSQALRQQLLDWGCDAERVSLIYNGVDPERFYLDASHADGDEYLLYIGNLKRDKGVIDLAYAYSAYRESGGKLPLRYVGAGPMAAELKQIFARGKLSDCVQMLGALPHERAAAQIRAASAVLLPSYHEGVPNVLLEAAASGVPCVATRVGGIPEIVKQDVTGILVDAGEIDQIAEAMKRVEDLSRWDSRAISEYGQSFRWSKNIEALLHLMSAASE